jgi:hypothetical protein
MSVQKDINVFHDKPGEKPPRIPTPHTLLHLVARPSKTPAPPQLPPPPPTVLMLEFFSGALLGE